VRGARQHNLKNILGQIPRKSFTVITELSGFGKIFAGLRYHLRRRGSGDMSKRFSAYARQFLDQMERPDVDSIDGLSPAISIEQKTPRAVRARLWDDYRDLRICACFFHRLGNPHCPKCGKSRFAGRRPTDRAAPVMQLRPKTGS